MHNMTFGLQYFVHFSGRRLSAVEVKKSGFSVMKSWNDNFDQFVNSIACFVVLTQNWSCGCTFILNNELSNKFLLGYVGIVWEVRQKIMYSLALAFSTPLWQTLYSFAKMHKIFIAQKSYCACCVLSLATIRSKYYFNFILNRTRSGRELFDRPS